MRVSTPLQDLPARHGVLPCASTGSGDCRFQPRGELANGVSLSKAIGQGLLHDRDRVKRSRS